ncbi:MAG: glycosyltransferase WbuB [Thiohalocapsa sp.]
MRILLYGLNFTPEPVGIGKYTGEMVRWLVARGHQVKIVCAPPYYPDWRVGPGYSARRYQAETIDGAEVLRCPLWIPKRVTGITRILHLFSFAFSSFIPMLWQRRWKPDVVFAIEPPLFDAVPALLSARLSGAHAWLHVQDFEIDAAFDLGLIESEPLRRLSFTIERALMRRFDRVSSISEKMVQRALVKTDDETGCVLFPNWVDTAKVFPVQRPSTYRATLGIPEDSIVLLYSGSMGAKQGLELILDAARELLHEPRYRFIMAGPGFAYERLLHAAADLNNMQWLPLQPEESLNEFLNLADIHLLPQKGHAADLVMPSKLTGMLSSGRPIITTALPDTQIAGVVEDAGLVVQPGCLQAVIAAIVRLGENPELRHTLGAAARDYATELLEHDNVLAGLEQELLAVLTPEPEPIQNTL